MPNSPDRAPQPNPEYSRDVAKVEEFNQYLDDNVTAPIQKLLAGLNPDSEAEFDQEIANAYEFVKRTVPQLVEPGVFANYIHDHFFASGIDIRYLYERIFKKLSENTADNQGVEALKEKLG